MGASSQGRRPRAPRREYKGIECRYFIRREAWLWRAVVTRNGRKVATGRFVPEQAEAHAEYLRLRREHAHVPVIEEADELTLGVALAIVRQDAEERGVAPHTLKRYYDCHAAHLKRYWQPEMPLEQIDVAEVRWLVSECLKNKRSPNTIINMDFPLLSRCFRLAKLEDPVPEAREQLRSTLKRVKPRMPFFEAKEMPGLIDRIRNPEAEPNSGRRRSSKEVAEAQADLVSIILCTGIRVLELGRVRIEDVDLEHGTIYVQSKDKTRPRHAHVVAALRPVLERQLRRARENVLAGKNPKKLLFRGGDRTITSTLQSCKARIGEDRLNGRALRHSFITGLLEAGETSLDVMGLAGHVRLSTTDRYVHELKHRRVDISARLAGRLGLGEAQEADETT